MLAVKVLELSFEILLGVMTIATGLIAWVVVVRIVEPGGTRVLLERLTGRSFQRSRKARKP